MRMTLKLHGEPLRVVHVELDSVDPDALEKAADAAAKVLSPKKTRTATRLGADEREG